MKQSKNEAKQKKKIISIHKTYWSKIEGGNNDWLVGGLLDTPKAAGGNSWCLCFPWVDFYTPW